MRTLDAGEINFIRLIARDADAEGWTAVSKPLYPLVQAMPAELVEHEPTENGRGRAKLTPNGKSVHYAMGWLRQVR